MKDDMTEQTNTHSGAILKELSDIKATLAVNTSETVNIKGTISEIKSDIKEIKNDFVSRREHNETAKEIRDQIIPIKNHVVLQDTAIDLLKTRINLWAGAFGVLVFLAPFIISYFTK